MKNNTDTAQSPKELLVELQALVAEAQSLVSDSLPGQSAEGLKNLRERFGDAQERFTELYQDTRKKVVAGARYTDTTIRENPYQSLAIALGIGAILGLVVGRSSK